MHDVTIRRATMNDAAAIASLAGELGYPASEDAMRPRLASQRERVLVAVVNDRVAAWIQLAFVETLESGTFAEITGLVVAEALRGRGIGARLVDAAESWARERGVARIRVRSNSVRAETHRFYERRGYAIAKTQHVFDKRLA